MLTHDGYTLVLDADPEPDLPATDRAGLREHMPQCRAWIEDAWRTFGSVQAIDARESGLRYVWRRDAG